MLSEKIAGISYSLEIALSCRRGERLAEKLADVL